ncbi:MAG: hypothetical protein E7D28_06680 [Clostridium sp.]|uniref:hypothetical protein n=1 Tax=Clostridium sp. TaxID=1506 RepID=UPI002900961A|nr:hypothetical protein [Clostridium sp.]MDU2459629.1 hypothetical protein [Clostridium sp.]
MLLDESYFDTFPKEVRYNKYVLVDSIGTLGENFIGAYDTEIEAYKDYKKVSTKSKRIFKANVTYVKLGNRNYMYSYEEI